MVKIHPVILIVCFLVFVALLAFPEPPTLLFSSLLVVFLYWINGGSYLASALVMLRRMRWFLCSILIVYCWFTPGEPIFQWPEIAAWLPTDEGLLSGAQRVLALVLVIAGVNLLLKQLSRAQLLAAIYLLSKPLQPFGIKAETVALRMVLVIDTVAEAQVLMSSSLPARNETPRKLAFFGVLAARIFGSVIERAENMAPHEISLPVVEKPPLVQWFLPLVLWGGFYINALLWSW